MYYQNDFFMAERMGGAIYQDALDDLAQGTIRQIGNLKHRTESELALAMETPFAALIDAIVKMRSHYAAVDKNFVE